MEQARQIGALVQGVADIVAADSGDWAYVGAVNDGVEHGNLPAKGHFDSTKSAAATARISGASDVKDHGRHQFRNNMMVVSLELQRHKAARAS
jgi:hypothetical protein